MQQNVPVWHWTVSEHAPPVATEPFATQVLVAALQVVPPAHCRSSEQALPFATEPSATHTLVGVSQLKPPAWLHWLSAVQVVGQVSLLPGHT